MTDDERERRMRADAERYRDSDLMFLLGRLDAAREQARAAIEEAAKIADRHVGAAKTARMAWGWRPSMEALDAILDEERGEDIAAVEIAKAIRRELIEKEPT